MAIPIGNIFQPPFMRGYVSLRECTPCALYLMNCFDFITPVKPIYFLPFKTGPLIQLNIFPITSSARNRGLYSNISKPGADARSENAWWGGGKKNGGNRGGQDVCAKEFGVFSPIFGWLMAYMVSPDPTIAPAKKSRFFVLRIIGPILSSMWKRSSVCHQLMGSRCCVTTRISWKKGVAVLELCG